MYSIVASVRSHPDAINPVRALYQKRSLESLHRYCESDIDAISPRPYAPPIGPYSDFRKIPKVEQFNGYELHHPRFLYLFPRRLFLTNITARSFRRTVATYANTHFSPPDIVHAGHIFLDGYGMIPYCKEHACPLTVMGRGGTLVNYPRYPNRRQKMISDTLEFADAVICVSEDLGEKAAQIAGTNSKIHVVPNGVNISRFDNLDRNHTRDQHVIAEDENLVLFCGEYRSHKGLNDIIDLLPELDVPKTHFIFVGQKDDLRDELEQAVRRSNIGDQSGVFYRMGPDELARYFVAADLFWLASYPGEGRPNVIYEAMASKTPVLATTVGGIPEQVNDHVTGLLIEPGDKEALKDRLEYMLENPKERKQMGEQGYSRLIDLGLTWENHAEKLAAIHREIIRKD